MGKRLVSQFEPVPPRYNAPQEEAQILAFWDRERVFERSVEQRPAGRSFVWFDGPPTANGKPGIHHVLARAFKDLIPRYQTMRGRRVERKAGWDTHGLPVELQVEKQLGISGKPQIESLVPGDVHASIARFNELCKQSVWQYKDEWERLVTRLGHWIDLEHPYITYTNEYIESVWWVLRQLWEKELLYEDFKVVPFCPRCGTALSSHEVAQGYDETTDRSVYVKFTVHGRKKLSLVAWTTTPWTLPGNLALAVGPSVRYGVYQVDGSEEQLIMADKRAQAVLGPAAAKLRSISIDELTTLSYEPLFVIPALQSEASYRVYPADFVSTDDGTGIVHTAVMYGEDDFALGSQINLPKHHTVDPEGKFTTDVADFFGQFVKDESTEQAIIDYLREGGALLREEPYTHTYPFCWRCTTPLIYYAKRSWFVRMSALRDELLATNTSIAWHPPHVQFGRFGEWLREVKDWALSRDRYWGTPLPIWQCDRCDHRICLGSIAELTDRSGQTVNDLHKPFIDDVHWACERCPGTMRRYPEVIDVWFDSGAMPFAQWHYPFDAASTARVDGGANFPADYIVEGLDQTRGWFYTLLAISVALGRGAPYRSVVATGLVFDRVGKKMSKSRGNVVDPNAVIARDGADALRFYFYSVNQPGDPKKIDPADIGQVTRKLLLILWNSYGFFAQRVQGESISTLSQAPATNHILDAWLISRTNALLRAVRDGLDGFDAFRASRAIADYVTELSTWYLKHSRRRTNASFLPTFGWALRQTALVMAPFTPFFAEALWQRLRSDSEPSSVHLADWPLPGAIDAQLLESVAALQHSVELGLAERAKAGVKVRQPLSSATVHGLTLNDELTAVLKEALNVKTITYVPSIDGAPISVALDLKLTDELRAEGLERELIRAIQELRKRSGLSVGARAIVTIDGPHELWPLIEPQLAAIGEITTTNVSRGEVGDEHATTVEGLTVSLRKS